MQIPLHLSSNFQGLPSVIPHHKSHHDFFNQGYNGHQLMQPLDSNPHSHLHEFHAKNSGSSFRHLLRSLSCHQDSPNESLQCHEHLEFAQETASKWHFATVIFAPPKKLLNLFLIFYWWCFRMHLEPRVLQ